jgi:hypothetical protein
LFVAAGEVPEDLRAESFVGNYKFKVKYSSNQLIIDCPKEMKKYFEYVKQLQFDQTPDYEFLKNLFQQSL